LIWSSKKRRRTQRMHELMTLELTKQRHEELLREVEMNRWARVLRATGRRGAGRRSVLVWEMKRYAGG
jgi:hypothetical protein